MAGINKRTISGKLNSLSEARKVQLSKWMLDGQGYDGLVVKIGEKWKVKTSTAALTSFFKSYVLPAVLEHRKRVGELALGIKRASDKQDIPWDHATLDALKQLATQLATAARPKVNDVQAIYALILKANADNEKVRERLRLEKKTEQELKNKERALRLMEKKFALYQKEMDAKLKKVGDAASKLGKKKGGITKADLARLERIAR